MRVKQWWCPACKTEGGVVLRESSPINDIAMRDSDGTAQANFYKVRRLHALANPDCPYKFPMVK